MSYRSIPDAIWAGNYWGRDGAVARAKRGYDGLRIYFSDEPPQALVDATLLYMNALYSAFGSVYPQAKKLHPRSLKRAVDVLLSLHPFLRTYQKEAEDRSTADSLTADQKEMLGAMLVKYATVPILGGPAYRDAAIEYAKAAVRASHAAKPHTAALAALTLARADIAIEGKGGLALEHLRYAEKIVDDVEDPNQKARILRSLAELYHELGDRTKALQYIRLAQDTPGIDADVRAKTETVGRTIWRT